MPGPLFARRGASNVADRYSVCSGPTAAARQQGATIFAYHVSDPERYGVVTFDENDRPVSIEEKPTRPSSNWAITGLCFFDSEVARHASKVRPSARGELEITDLQMRYLAAGKLDVERAGRGFAWLDTRTFGSLIDAVSFVQTLELRQGMKVACLEQIAFRLGFIDRDQALALAKLSEKTGYEYLIERVGSSQSGDDARKELRRADVAIGFLHDPVLGHL